ncbi:GIY-YIG nuclease family protein [Candidatus Parcubacteria bacterium]|nr:GIY-YIG nuclease family protein [Candidatus Parcubacteria bacterium]
MFYVYLLECQDDKSWYIGYTSDLKRRISDHQNGYGCRTTSAKNNKVISRQATKNGFAISRQATKNGFAISRQAMKNNWKLIYYEAYIEKRDAIGREKFLKSGSGRKYLNKQLRNYLGCNF